MPVAFKRDPLDWSVQSARPNVVTNRTAWLRVQAGQWKALMFFGLPPRNAVITGASLFLRCRQDWNGTRDITVKRLTKQIPGRATWNNAPGTTGSGQTTTVTAKTKGEWVELPIGGVIQAALNSGTWFGVEITSSGGAGIQEWFSSESTAADSQPYVRYAWTAAPDVPTDLSPSANNVVASAKPTLTWKFEDHFGDTSLGAVQVQVNGADSWSSPAFDSGVVPSDHPQLDLGSTSYGGIPAGGSVFWRCRHKDGAGLWSPWSDAARMRYVGKGTVTIINPPDTGLISDITPQVTWTFNGTQTAYNVIVRRPWDPSIILWESGKTTSSEQSVQVPRMVLDGRWRVVLEDDRNYEVAVRVWDDQDREATPGDPTFAWAAREFHVDDDANTGPVTNLQIVTGTHRPRATLTWDRTEMPDTWVIRRDGRVVEEIDAADLVFGSGYRYLDDEARPWRDHTWRVHAKVNGKMARGVEVSGRTEPDGIWLLDRDRGLAVWIVGAEEGSHDVADVATTYEPMNSRNLVVRSQARRAPTGQVTGQLIDSRDGRSWEENEEDLFAMKRAPREAVTLVKKDFVARVRLMNVNVFPDPGPMPERRLSLDWVQVNDPEWVKD